MTPAYQHDGVTLYTGCCKTVLAALPTGCCRTCVTSPPYYGLRDYGTATWKGGDPACDHKKDTQHRKQGSTSQRKGRTNAEAQQNENFVNTCPRCGAVRVDTQIGLEATPEAYVANLVAVFAAVWRVLADDGTLWLNLGDSYNAAGRVGHGTRIGRKQGTNRASANGQDNSRANAPALKPKDLIGIPWMVAFALRAAGWHLRSDIIWHKPNAMPESVGDRPTKAHEYIFLFSKQERYYYDAAAISEPALQPFGNAAPAPQLKYAELGNGLHRHCKSTSKLGTNCGSVTRNKRSVWAVNVANYAAAHFATYPPELITPCILAGAAVGDTVLDPFSGSGTTAWVARQHGRKAIGIELNPEYQKLAISRFDQGMLFGVEEVASG